MGYDNRISILRGDTFITMTEEWELRTKGHFETIKDPKKILEAIKEAQKKGDGNVTINGRKVRIIQRDGQDAWEYIPGVY